MTLPNRDVKSLFRQTLWTDAQIYPVDCLIHNIDKAEDVLALLPEWALSETATELEEWLKKAMFQSMDLYLLDDLVLPLPLGL